MIVLFSTGCPKCSILKKKLKQKGIVYQENNSVEEMLGLGITQVPVLKIRSRLLEFADANDWVNKQESAE